MYGFVFFLCSNTTKYTQIEYNITSIFALNLRENKRRWKTSNIKIKSYKP